MPKIGIIDDKDDVRVTLARAILVGLQGLEKDSEWATIETRPFVDMEEYVSWINANDIAVLTVDERLDEDVSNGSSVHYRGSDLIDFLRMSFKELPIYAISSFIEDPDLQNKFSSFDDIIPRIPLSKDPEKYIERFLRAGEKFLNTNLKKLSELTELSEKIATGNFIEEDVLKANAIQKDLEIPFEIQEVRSRREWLKKFETEINEMEDLQEKIKKFIDKKK
jgi:hypothetical protein